MLVGCTDEVVGQRIVVIEVGRYDVIGCVINIAVQPVQLVESVFRVKYVKEEIAPTIEQ